MRQVQAASIYSVASAYQRLLEAYADHLEAVHEKLHPGCKPKRKQRRKRGEVKSSRVGGFRLSQGALRKFWRELDGQ